MKLQYSVLNARYTQIKAEYSQIIKENTKLKETVKEQEKLINNLKKEALELGYLLSVKVEELGEKRICIIQR